jgi:FkbM family methyltransferase
MLDILTILAKPLQTIRVLDIGAMMGGTDVYEPLRVAGIANVVGFEPQPSECEKLNAAHASRGDRYLPYFIGDGTARTFHITRDRYSSSLYAPNLPLVSKFQQLGEYYQVVETQTVQTKRLDDLPEVRPIDLVKIDTQGAELDVIRGGEATIGEALVIHSEVEFVEMYKSQPLFADIDAAMRKLGFSFLKFHSIAGRAFVPLVLDHPSKRISQMMWADAVYVRDFMSFERLSPQQLIKIAIMAHMMYGAVDLAHLALANHDRTAGTKLAETYLHGLTQGATA